MSAGPNAGRLTLRTPEETDALGRALGAVLRAGDVVILAGGLGAGKTALTKGVGAGMGVGGTVTSPTFVLARRHPPLTGGTALVHVDAYRLDGRLELDDLDLDTDLARSAVVIEWGSGLAEQLSDAHLRVELTRHPDDTRTAVFVPVGGDWADRLSPLLAAAAGGSRSADANPTSD